MFCLRELDNAHIIAFISTKVGQCNLFIAYYSPSYRCSCERKHQHLTFPILHLCHIQIFYLSVHICPSGSLLTQKFSFLVLQLPVCAFLAHYSWLFAAELASFFGLCVCEYRGLSQLLRQVRVFTVLFKKFPMLVHTGPLSSYPITPNYCRESEVKHLYAPNMLMHAGVCMSVTPVCTSSVAPTQKEQHVSTGLLGRPWKPFCCLMIHQRRILSSSR